MIKALEHLRFRGNEVIVFHALDRQEIDFDFDEPLVLEDAETEEQLHVLPDVLRDEYLRAIRPHIEAFREGATRSRIDYELLQTSEPLDLRAVLLSARRSSLTQTPTADRFAK